jgi:hypothetical protein
MTGDDHETIYVDGLDELKDPPDHTSTVTKLLSLDLPVRFSWLISSRWLPALRSFVTENQDNILHVYGGESECKDIVRKLLLQEFGDTLSDRSLQSLVWRCEGNIQYAEILTKASRQNNKEAEYLLTRAPAGLFNLYEGWLHELSDRITNTVLLEDIRAVMRFISIFEESYSARWISNLLGIDSMDIQRVFSPLICFMDRTGLHLCSWHHSSFGEFLSSVELLSSEEEARLRLRIAKNVMKRVASGRINDIPDEFLERYHRFILLDIEGESSLKEIRDRLVKAICYNRPLCWMLRMYLDCLDLACRQQLVSYAVFFGLMAALQVNGAWRPNPKSFTKTNPLDNEVVRSISSGDHDIVAFIDNVATATGDGDLNGHDVVWLLQEVVEPLRERLKKTHPIQAFYELWGPWYDMSLEYSQKYES